MVSSISFGDSNSGLQLVENHGHISVQLQQSEVSLSEACLRDLRTTDPHDDKSRIQQAKGGLFTDSYRWILDNQDFKQWKDNQSGRLLWIKGDPGKGKTMLLCGIIDELATLIADTGNLAFFFCQATDSRINTATAILRGLIYSLVQKRQFLLSYVGKYYNQAGKQLFEDTNAWHAVSRIFTNILRDTSMQNTILIIDALDECKSGLPSLLNLIVHESSDLPYVKWIVSSRNWPEIEEQLETATQTAPLSLELNGSPISEAVSNFIRRKVSLLAAIKKYDGRTSEIICRYLSSNSQGTFLWVALVCEELTRISRRHTLKKLKAFPTGLNALYNQMIDRIHGLDETDSKLCIRVLAIISAVYRPLTLEELKEFLDDPSEDLYNDEDLSDIIMRCGSFLTIRDDVIRFVHQSAQDFLKSSSKVFTRGIEAEHHRIFSRSLKTMSKTLRRDIYNIKAPGLPIERIPKPHPDPLAVVRYSCVYWADHLRDSESTHMADNSLDEGGFVDRFLQETYLHWLEALSLLESVSQGVAALLKIESLLKNKRGPQTVLYRVRDASRFLRYYKLAIESSPLQIYSSPLTFSPTRSITRKCFEKEKPDWVLNEPAVVEDWSLCLQTLEGHRGWVREIAWAHDGSRLASASDDKTVRVWDLVSGQCVSKFEGHSDLISSIAWSQSGCRIASASFDTTISIWDPNSGRYAITLKGHTNRVRMIDWSQDGNRIASASEDKTLRVWDPENGQCLLTLEGHSDMVMSVAWSQHENRLASGSMDKTVRIWDLASTQCISILEGHSSTVSSVVWSQSGNRLASTSNDKIIRIWDPVKSHCMSTLEGHNGSIYSIIWAQDGSQLASGSSDHTVRIWDPATGQCLLILKGHSDAVMSVAWSRDESRLASGSMDRTVRIWDPTTSQCISILEGHSNTVSSIAWSPDESRIASASWDTTVRVWDSTTHQHASELERYCGSVCSIACSEDGSRLASASDDKRVMVWDLATGQCTLTLEGHTGPVRKVEWSQDGKRLASVSDDNTVRIWDPIAKKHSLPLEGHIDKIVSILWTQDGSRLASASWDKTIRIWDPSTGQCISTLKGHSGPVWSISWSPDRCRLASASLDNTIKIWDPITGMCMLTLQGHGGSIISIAWSQDGSRLASASIDKLIRIWNLATRQCVLTLQGHRGTTPSIAWSRDGSRLATASVDNTVRIWDLATSQCMSEFSICSPDFLQFDKANPNYLHTSIGKFKLGTVRLSPNCSSSLPEQYGYGLNSDRSWITYNGLNLLWLPAEYRPASSALVAMTDTKLAICCSSRRVIFIMLSEHNPISQF